MCLFLAYFANHNPKKFVRIGHPLSVTLMLVIIAFFFTVEMFYVAPQIFGEVGHHIFWLISIFIMHNILGNMWACYCISSSVASLPKDRRVPAPEEEHLWHYCEACRAMMPPRSWHCKLCNVCILKREHHCSFTATCIGHKNHRYFFWFTFYLLLAIIICMYTLFVFITTQEDLTMESPVLWLFPLEFLALFAAVATWGFQVSFICRNATNCGKDGDTYNLGLRENLVVVLGQRGLWTMLSPAIKSPLPHEGTQWRLKQST